MKRKDFQKLARLRLREARVLLRSRNPEGAYYLAGYSVECALKSCLARKVERHEIPQKDWVNKIYTHNLAELVKQAGLTARLDMEMKSNKVFAEYWGEVMRWKSESRYRFQSISSARELYKAITDRRQGVLRWLRQHW